MSEDESPIKQDLELLINTLKSDPDWNQRFGAASKLFRLAVEKAVDPLINALQNDPHKEVRRHAANLLGRIGDPRATWALIAVLRQGLKDNDSRMIFLSSDGLLRIGGDDLTTILIQTIDDEQEFFEMRLKALELLGKIGDSKATQALIEQISNPDYDRVLKKQAIEELAYTGHLAGIQLLIDLLEESADKELKRVIAIALGKTPFKNKTIIFRLGDVLLKTMEQENEQGESKDNTLLNLLASAIKNLAKNIEYDYREFIQEIIDIRQKQKD